MAALLAALLLPFGCEGGDPTGGETHFLTACSATAACEDGLSCQCGLCTRPCAELDDCRGLGAECVAPVENASCAPAETQAFCDVRCATDADCAALSRDHRCEGGHCRGRADPGSTAECPRSELDPNQVLVIGDSFFAASHQITPFLEEQARAAGALSPGERYQDNSSLINNALALTGNHIAAQYAEAAAEVDVKVVIMNGGGADVLVGSCDTPSTDCPVLVAASAALEELFLQMAADGVEQVVYVFYPDPVDIELREKMDALRPLIEADCAMSPLPCHWIDLRPTFAGRYEDYVQDDGRNPTAQGAEASAAAIWATLRDRCIAQ